MYKFSRFWQEINSNYNFIIKKDFVENVLVFFDFVYRQHICRLIGAHHLFGTM